MTSGEEAQHHAKTPHKGSPTQKIPPEEITDDSPIIRDSQSPKARPIGEKQIYRLTHNLFHRVGLTRKNKHGSYELTFHSLRTFFKTEMKTRGLSDPDLIDYWMGHVVDVYNDIQSRGISTSAASTTRPTSGSCLKLQAPATPRSSRRW